MTDTANSNLLNGHTQHEYIETSSQNPLAWDLVWNYIVYYKNVVFFSIWLGARGQRRRLYETPSVRNTEKIERRTSNVQHRILYSVIL